eukprot:g2060.t1
MGDAAVNASPGALLLAPPRKVTVTNLVPTTISSADGTKMDRASEADTAADGAAGPCKKGGEEKMWTAHEEASTEGPRKQPHAQLGGGDALPRSASSVTQPDTQQQPYEQLGVFGSGGGGGDALPRSASSVTQPSDAPAAAAAAGAPEMCGPVEAETSQCPQWGQQQSLNTTLPLPSRPPVRTLDSNAESLVDPWDGALEEEPAERGSPSAVTRSAAARRDELAPAGGATWAAAAAAMVAGDVQDEGRPGASPRLSAESAKPGRPSVSLERTSDENKGGAPPGEGGEGEKKGDDESEAKGESMLPDPMDLWGQPATDDAAVGARDVDAKEGGRPVESRWGVWPEPTAAAPLESAPSPRGQTRDDGEEPTSIGAAGTAAVEPSVAAATAAAACAASVDHAIATMPVSSAAAEDEQDEKEQLGLSKNHPSFQSELACSQAGAPNDASCVNCTGGISTPFSPVSIETSGGNAAAAETSTDHRAVSSSPGDSSSTAPKAATTMLARLRRAARVGGTSLFSRRRAGAASTTTPDRPLPPAPHAENDGAPLSSGTDLPALPPHKAVVVESGGGGGPLPLPMPTGPGGWDKKGGAWGGDGKAPAFENGGVLAGKKTPLMSPERSRTASAASAPAGGRREVAGDVEEGGARAAVAAAVDGGVAAVAVAAAATASQIVLPCAPSDEEKILYDKTGRLGMVAFATAAFVALSAGMWLFTLVTPAFYWFGGPATFIVFYTAAHYFVVAMWGEDFDPAEHANVIQRSEEKGYRPKVDVFLPVCKEPLHLLANTWMHVAALDYPDVKVYVLDDGKSDEVKTLAASFGFEYVLRDDAPELKKAGNLRNAFARTSGDAIAIFDADFCPRADFLKETVPYLGEDPSIGIVQTPQFFRHRDEQTWVEQGAGVTQEYFYRMVQMNQDRFNAAVCVGSCGLYRRKALEPLGGMAAIEHSEDMYTGYLMTEHGFKIKYMPQPLAMGICPDEPQSFFMQQYRWCKGSCTLLTEKGFWGSTISKIHKLCFLNGLLYYIATALLVFIAPMPILLLVWTEADGVLWYHSCFVLPSIVFASVVMPLWSKQPYGMACHRVKIIQCYAHMFAIKDSVMGRSAPWVPSGHGRSRLSSSTYKSSVRLLIGWNVLITALIVGGSAWRMTLLTWYHFLPAIGLAVGSFALNMSTLVY